MKDYIKKPINFFSKILQNVLMNYFLENYVSPLLKESLKERSFRAVRYRLESELKY